MINMIIPITNLHFLLPLLLCNSLVNAIDAWHLDSLYTLSVERLDPIVSPNSIGGHTHRILGGNMFGASYDGTAYQSQSTCTTASVQKDYSNYWMPQLFWQENGQFIPVDASTRFYYFLGRNNATTPVQAFPTGLRMLVGNPNAKTSIDNAKFAFVCQKNHYDIAASEDKSGANFNFATDCPQGMKTEIRFPPCWDGINLYKPDGSHMAYASVIHAGYCPYSHPVRLPGIVLEYTWHTNLLRPGVPLKGKLVWANGDITGYGVHADFVAGWDRDVLNYALNDPACLNKGEVTMSACPSLAKYMVTKEVAESCKPSRGVYNESVVDGVAMKALPGCNVPWASGDKPTCATAPSAPALPGSLTGTDGPITIPGASSINSVQTALNLANIQAGLPGKIPSISASQAASYDKSKWSYIGCLGSSTNSTDTMLSKIGYSDFALTLPKCQQYCYEQGYPYSAAMAGVYCQCARAINPDAYVMDTCTAACPGDSSKKCGGNGILSVYYNPTITAAPVIGTDPSYLGCKREASGGKHTLSLSYVGNKKAMTVESCKSYCVGKGFKIAGLEFGYACMCGNSFTNGGGGPMPEFTCNSQCAGNSKEICGGVKGSLSTFDLTKSAAGHKRASRRRASIQTGM